MYICNICNRNFKTKRSLSSHKNHHNPEYSKRSKKGSEALLSEKAKESRKLTFERKKLEKWLRQKHVCIICNTNLSFPQTKNMFKRMSKTI